MKKRNVKQLMKTRFPVKIFRLLERVGRVAAKEKCSVYLVGGMVRDLLLNIENWEIDISDDTLIIDLKNSNNYFYDAISTAYPILNDDQNLRGILNQPIDNQAKFFDQLRKSYPRRREFKNYTLLN